MVAFWRVLTRGHGVRVHAAEALVDNLVQRIGTVVAGALPRGNHKIRS